jgi:hypothetical protein
MRPDLPQNSRGVAENRDGDGEQAAQPVCFISTLVSTET